MIHHIFSHYTTLKESSLSRVCPIKQSKDTYTYTQTRARQFEHTRAFNASAVPPGIRQSALNRSGSSTGATRLQAYKAKQNHDDTILIQNATWDRPILTG